MWVSIRIGTFLLIVELFHKRPHGTGLQKLVVCNPGLVVIGDVVVLELAKLGAYAAIVDIKYGLVAMGRKLALLLRICSFRVSPAL